MESRRGFLKTLGKLGAAVGIMTSMAACFRTLPKPHSHPTPGPHKHPAREAKIPATPKAKIKLKPRSDGMSKMLAGTDLASNSTTSNADAFFSKYPAAGEAILK